MHDYRPNWTPISPITVTILIYNVRIKPYFIRQSSMSFLTLENSNYDGCFVINLPETNFVASDEMLLILLGFLRKTQRYKTCSPSSEK